MMEVVTTASPRPGLRLDELLRELPMAAQIVDLPTPPFEEAKEIIMKHSGMFKGRGNWTNIFLPIWSNNLLVFRLFGCLGNASIALLALYAITYLAILAEAYLVI